MYASPTSTCSTPAGAAWRPRSTLSTIAAGEAHPTDEVPLRIGLGEGDDRGPGARASEVLEHLGGGCLRCREWRCPEGGRPAPASTPCSSRTTAIRCGSGAGRGRRSSPASAACRTAGRAVGSARARPGSRTSATRRRGVGERFELGEGVAPVGVDARLTARLHRHDRCPGRRHVGAQALGERTDEQQDLGLGSAHRLGVERTDARASRRRLRRAIGRRRACRRGGRAGCRTAW